MSALPITNGVNGAHTNGTNGVSKVSRPLTAGIYAPIPSFFDVETEDLGKHVRMLYAYRILLTNPGHRADVQTFASHIVRLARAGVRPVIAGSMGEAHHLSHHERITLIKAARSALDEAGFDEVVGLVERSAARGAVVVHVGDGYAREAERVEGALCQSVEWERTWPASV